MFRILTAVLLAAWALDVQAYIGPGAGVGFLGSLWAWLVGLLVVFAAILIWPLRWFWRRMRGRTASAHRVDRPSPDE